MRRVRIALIVAVVLGGTTPVLRAQMAHSALESEYGCQSCVPAGMDDACCTPLLTTLTRGMQQLVGCVLPGGACCDARHHIYRAALRRNAFDKACFPLLPFYSRRNCVCGPTPACPHCGPAGHQAGEVFETQEGYYEEGVLEPTPAHEMPSDVQPDGAIQDRDARWKPSKSPTRAVRSAQRSGALRPAAPPLPGDVVVGSFAPRPANPPVQRTNLRQAEQRAGTAPPLRN